MEIQIDHISLAFKERQLFRDFSLHIESGEKVLIQADSGHGKSTLLKMLFGFQQPDKGSIRIGGKLLNDRNFEQIRASTGYIAQSAPLPKGDVADVIHEMKDFEKNQPLHITDQQVKDAFRQYQLPADIWHKKTEDLSGGERHRLCFAFLTRLKRDVWLLDEITSGLDQKNCQKVMDTVENTRATVIITAHDKRWEKTKSRKIKLHE